MSKTRADSRWLLTIKIGNTNLGFGLHADGQLAHTWRAETRVDKTADEYAAFLLTCFENVGIAPADIHRAALVSVVPPLTDTMREMCRAYLQLEPFVAASGIQSGIQIRYDDPRALGALSARCVDAHSTTGPVQSCGATGRCQASAMAAILRASERPPHQATSSMTTPATPVSRRSRKAKRLPSVSEAQIGAGEACA